MYKRALFSTLLFFALSCFLLPGCSGKKTQPDHSGPPRDNIPDVLTPSADGAVTYGNEYAVIDASHTAEGYVMVNYTGQNEKVKLQILTPDQKEYTYLLSGRDVFSSFPLSAGDGTYTVQVLENIEGDSYALCLSQEIEVTIKDEFNPFLYPNQYVNFTSESAAVAKGAELSKGCYSDLEVIQNVYSYVTENISYDTQKANSVTYGYLPVVDDTLSSGTGICFDYAALMSAMLRSQGIPTKLEVGYAGEALHSWISTYVDDIGWVDNIIEFDGTSWELLDPTLAANNSKKDIKKYIGDGANYTLKYSY